MKCSRSFLSILAILISFLSVDGSVSAQIQKKQTQKSPLEIKSQKQELKKENLKKRMMPTEVSDLYRHSRKIRQYPLELIETRTNKASDKATVVLAVEVDWGDGSGYQMLLDADHNTFGTVIPADGPLTMERTADYSEFEYTIPTDAEGDVTTDKIVTTGEQVSMEIEPGTYDFCVVNPTPNDKIYIASGEMARQDDFKFEAGIEYIFTVSPLGNYDNCEMRIASDDNIAITDITSPLSGTELTAAEPITIKLKNEGKKDISSVKLSYTINGGTPVVEEADVTLSPNGESSYTFKTKADFSAEKKYEIFVKAELQGDLDQRNDTLRKMVYHVAPVPTPFICNFEDETSMDNWVVIDNNGDGSSWIWNNDSYETKPEDSGSAYISTSSITIGKPEYLVTLSPISLKAGNNHMTWFYHVDSWGSNEHITILYGKSSNVEEMEVLSDRPSVTDMEWSFDIINFTLAESGNYYFAFAAKQGSDAWNYSIDNVKIDEGSYYGVPDLRIDQALVPISSCGLNSEKIGMKVTNIGQGDISKYCITYTINGGEKVSDTIEGEIAIKQTKEIYFSKEVDLSVPDKKYEISMSISVIAQGEEKPEDSLGNNTISTQVINYTPTEIPFFTRFNVESERNNWDSEVDGSWYYDETSSYYWNLAPYELYSRCVDLEAGKDYRFTMNYGAGDIVWIFQVTEDFAIVYGETGTEISTWDTILKLEQQYTEGKIVEEYASFKPEKSGNYTFAVVPITCNQTLCLKDISISEISDYDIQMTNFAALPHMIPVEHANNTFNASVSIKNMGRLDVDKAKVSIEMKGEILGSKEFAIGKPEAEVTTDVEMTVKGLKVKEEATFTAKAQIVGQTDGNPDNELSQTSTITDDLLAYDKITEEMCSDENYIIGAESYLACGTLMQFTVKDTLTGISIMWGASEQNMQTDICIYKYDMEKAILGEMIYSGNFEKGTEAGEKRYDLPALMLENGYYIVSVGIQDYVLATDMDPNGILYIISDGTANIQKGLGFPGIRAIFGHNGNPNAKDAYIAEISKPAEKGLFAENEPIVIKVGNNGYEDITAPVNITINGKALESKEVEIPAYGKTEVEFTADLSKSGSEYEIVAFTSMTGDQNLHNDTLSKTVICLEPADPYEMDFEYCTDFAIEGFNPAWKSVDVDAAPTYGFQGIQFPHAGEAFGFMAFNPAMTEPAMTPEEIPDIQPHNGNRLGVSFVSSTGTNNDWLISPKLTLPKTDANMSLFVKTFIEDYGLESYNVLISATEDLDDFVEIHSAEAPVKEWEEVKIDLSDYAGKSVYIAIQCVSADRFIFMVDDIRISKPETGNESPVNAQLSVYPNPANDRIVIHSTDAIINQVSIFNIGGVEVYSSNHLHTRHYTYRVSELGSGIYFARVMTNQGIVTLKFVVL